MKKIPLTQGMFALVDDEDYEELSKFKWTSDKRSEKIVYAYRRDYSEGAGRKVYMHRYILSPNGVRQIVDHKDGNGLNNQRNNLRICGIAENNLNRDAKGGKTHNFKGVFWFKRDSKWQAQIGLNGKKIHLGYFDDILEAARHYNKAALEYHREFCKLNEVSPLLPI